MPQWETATPRISAYYYAIPKDRDSWLDGSPEVVYVYFDGRRKVLRPGQNTACLLDEFSHWWGPLELPALPQEVSTE